MGEPELRRRDGAPDPSPGALQQAVFEAVRLLPRYQRGRSAELRQGVHYGKLFGEVLRFADRVADGRARNGPT